MFDFVPVFLIVGPCQRSAGGDFYTPCLLSPTYHELFLRPYDTSYVISGGKYNSNSFSIRCEIKGNKIEWYTNDNNNEFEQLNVLGQTYRYISVLY